MARTAVSVVVGALCLLQPQRSDADVMWDYLVVATSCLADTCRSVSTGNYYVPTPDLARVSLMQSNGLLLSGSVSQGIVNGLGKPTTAVFRTGTWPRSRE